MLVKLISTSSLLLTILTFCTAQKIKVKDDQVLVDNVPVLNIKTAESDKLKSWFVLTLSGDTVATFLKKRILLTLLPHELYQRGHLYYEVRFTDSDKIGYMSENNLIRAHQIGDHIRYAGCFTDGRYTGNCAKSVMDKCCNWTADQFKLTLNANHWRDSILKDEKYLKYSAGLPKRNASLDVTIGLDSTITVFDIALGRFHVLTRGTTSITYRVMDPKNQPLATINHEYSKHRVFIRHLSSKDGREYFINHDFTSQDLNDAINYLVDYGYL